MAKLRALLGVFLRASTTRGRLVGLLLLAVTALGLALVVRTAPDAGPDAPSDLVDALGLALIVPVGSLLVATATLGQLRNDGTLVYVWLRPVVRALIAVAAWIAAVLVALPAVAAPLVGAAVVAGAGAGLVAATALATGLAVAAYCGVFVALGLVTRHAAIWGLGYILIWEGILAALGGGLNRLALRSYSRSVLEDVGGVDLPLANVSTATAVVVLAGVAAVAVALTARRLARMDVE